MSRERIIVSGINGFVGYHLAKELKKANLFIIGIGRDKKANSEVEGIIDEYYQADLTKNWPNIINIKSIIHLAGLAAVGPSFENPQLYINTNSSMVTNLCEFYDKQKDKPRIVIVSSGAVYSPDQPMPINESGKIDYSSPYAISKILTENQAKYYRKRGLDCVVARPFNHIGPGQNQGFILPDLYNRMSSVKGDEINNISVGNLETRRDYTDVRDVARAYTQIALSSTLQKDTYNICSNISISGVEIFNELKTIMNLSNIGYKIDQSLIRPSDIMNIVGDSSQLKNELNWSPRYNMHQTILDFVESKTS